ncbi:MAG: ATP-binding protein [Xanthomonadales bacterium]|nr:ATP-binding protein [Xanthomonadales bacterium]
MNQLQSIWSDHPLLLQLRLRLLDWLVRHRPGKPLDEALADLDKHSPGVLPVAASAPFPCELQADLLSQAGLGQVASVFGLDEGEMRLLTLALVMRLDEVLADWLNICATPIGNQTAFHMRLLAAWSDLPVTRVERALRWRGALRQSGLVSSYRGANILQDRVSASANLLEYVGEQGSDIDELCKGSFSICQPAQLRLDDYAHLQADVQRILGRLGRREPGTHVLLYGPPGTGKTQLAHCLAAALGWSLYAVASVDQDGDPIEHYDRLLAYGRAQTLLGLRSDALLLFDEVEDVMRASGPARDGQHRAVSYKGWLNEQLERNATPSIWISNSLSGFDEAQLRRFACLLEVPAPGRAQRLVRAERLGVELGLERPWVQALAERDDLAPADIDAAQREARDMAVPAEAFRDALASRLRASGRAVLRPWRAPSYDLRFTHARPGAGELLANLQRFPQARVLLSGPPGCGKTALAVAAAQQLQRPLLQRRASDLLSPWLGETEQRLAEAFADALRDDAVLLIDEVDSFLQARATDSRRWELSQVNEFLKQLEDFDGCFFAATNLVESLDPAAIRRFDYRLQFDWLPLAARLALLEAQLDRFAVSERLDCGQRQARLAELPWLLPGDFAALRRRAEAAMPALSETQLLDWLIDIQAAKPEARRRPMGFLVSEGSRAFG